MNLKLIFNSFIYRVLFSQSTVNSLKKLGSSVGKNIFIGDNVYIEKENAELLTIEDDVVISAFTKFVFHDSCLNNVAGMDIAFGKIILKKNCYIGLDCILLPGTIIGENTIIGAGSLAKGIFKSNSVYYGRPAKYVCSLDNLKKKWSQRQEGKILEIAYLKEKKWYKQNIKDKIEIRRKKKDLFHQLNNTEIGKG